MTDNMIPMGSIKEAYNTQMHIQKLSKVLFACVLLLIVQLGVQLFGLFDNVVVDSYPKAIFHLIYPFTCLPLIFTAAYCFRKKAKLKAQLGLEEKVAKGGVNQQRTAK